MYYFYQFLFFYFPFVIFILISITLSFYNRRILKVLIQNIPSFLLLLELLSYLVFREYDILHLAFNGYVLFIMIFIFLLGLIPLIYSVNIIQNSNKLVIILKLFYLLFYILVSIFYIILHFLSCVRFVLM